VSPNIILLSSLQIHPVFTSDQLAIQERVRVMVAYARMLPIADETVIYDCPRRSWDSLPSGPVGVGPKQEPKMEQEDVEQRDEEASSSTASEAEARIEASASTSGNQQAGLAPVPSKDDELTIVYEKVRGGNGAQVARGQGNFEVGDAECHSVNVESV
jgi:hypothetical protein